MIKGLDLYTVQASGKGTSFKSNRVSSKAPNALGAVESSGRFSVQAAFLNNNGGSSVQNVVAKNNMVNLLDGFVTDDLEARRRMYHDIYRYDGIAGSAVDVFSQLPFSSFDLTGIEDEEILEVYQKSCDNLRLKTLIPSISRDFLTLGAFIGTTLFDKNQKVFTHMMPQNLSSCVVTEVPIYGVDPIIDLRIPPTLKNMLKDKDPRLQKIFGDLPPQIRQDMNQGLIKLPPDTTLYLARKTLTSDFIGTSYLERMLPIHLYEKTLYRGTLDQANRRQRAIFWAQCLTGDTLISVDGKLKRIDSICSRKGMKPGTAVDVKFKTRGRHGKIVGVNKWLYQGKKQVSRVTTESGYSIKATSDHRMLTINNNLDFVWKKVEELNTSDYLCLDPSRGETTNNELKLNLNSPSVEHFNTRIYKIPQVMTPELAYLLGIVVSEGMVNKYSVQASNADIKIINNTVKLFKNVFGIEAKINTVYPDKKNPKNRRTVPLHTVSANSTFLVDLFVQLGIPTNKTIRKNPKAKDLKKVSSVRELPWSILQSDKESKYAFIAAYIDGDGSVIKDKRHKNVQVESHIFSSSKKLITQFQVMLLDLGIISTISRGDTCWSVLMTRETGGIYYNKIKKYMKHSFKVFSGVKNAKNRHNGLPVSKIQPLINQRYIGRGERRQYVFRSDEGLPITPYYWGTHCDQVFEGRVNNRLIYQTWRKGTYEKAFKELEAFSPSILHKIRKVLEKGTLFEKVVSIKPLAKKQHVYDLSIDQGNKNTFVANGFEVHNCGDEEWIPDQSDLDNITKLFQSADADPTGAIITTRNSIQAQEIRQATDFFRYDEVDPYFSQAKYRCLGITEAIITGEFSISTLDATLSVLVDSFKAYREMLTRDIFYDKIFPAVAIANNFKSDEYTVRSSRRASENFALFKKMTCEDRTRSFTIKGVNYNTKNYLMPNIDWHKHLKPEGDSSWLQLLADLSEKGLPVTLGMYAAAAGLNLDSIIKSMEPDLQLRNEVASYLKKVNKINATIMPQDQDGQQMQAKLAAYASSGSSVEKVGLFNREFDDTTRMYERKKNGKYRLTSKRRVKEMEEDARKKIAEALANFNKKQNKRIKQGKPERPAKVLSSAIFGILNSQKGM